MTFRQRRSTVHDLATLRLHQNGTHIQNPNNRTSRLTTYTVRDARGNWFARDAAGLGTTKKRPIIPSEDGEVFDIDAVRDSSAGEKDELADNLTGTTGVTPHNRRIKQLRFNEDLDFQKSAPSTSAGKGPSIPVDLLTETPDFNLETSDEHIPSSVSVHPLDHPAGHADILHRTSSNTSITLQPRTIARQVISTTHPKNTGSSGNYDEAIKTRAQSKRRALHLTVINQVRRTKLWRKTTMRMKRTRKQMMREIRARSVDPNDTEQFDRTCIGPSMDQLSWQ